MLVESADVRITLDFEINKDVSLHTFLGSDRFRGLIKRTVEILADSDLETCICLLDKIKETKQVLQSIIKLQWQQI